MIEKFFRISAAGLGFQKDSLTDIREEDWERIVQLGLNTGTYGVIFLALASLPERSAKLAAHYERLQKLVIVSAIQEEKKVYQIKKIQSALDKNGIKQYIFLKGLAIKRLYSNPDARVMVDIDLFSIRDEFTLTVDVLTKMGYVCDEEDQGRMKAQNQKHSYHIGFRKAGAAYLELHFALGVDSFRNRRSLQKWCEQMVSNSQSVSYQGFSFRSMGDDDLFVYLLIHMINHLVTGNCSFKQIVDFAVYLHGVPIDYPYVFRQTDALNITLLAKVIICLCQKYFNLPCNTPWAVEEHYRLADKLCTDIYEKNGHRLTNGPVPSFRFPLFYKTRLFRPLLYIQEAYRLHSVYQKGFRESFIVAGQTCRQFYHRWPLLKELHIF